MDKLFSYGFVMAFMVGLIWLTVRYVRKAERAEVKRETSEGENETIKENRKATAIKEHELATASDDERIRLRKKWSRKP